MTGAGVGSHTAAFIHQTTSGVSGNISGDYSTIDNPLCNGRQNALLFVTHNFNPSGSGGAYPYEIKPYGVYYDGSNWNIYHEDTSTMTAGLYFNVLIINPA